MCNTDLFTYNFLVINLSRARITTNFIAFFVLRINKFFPFLKPASLDKNPIFFTGQLICKSSKLLLWSFDFFQGFELLLTFQTLFLFFFIDCNLSASKYLKKVLVNFYRYLLWSILHFAQMSTRFYLPVLTYKRIHERKYIVMFFEKNTPKIRQRNDWINIDLKTT